MIGSLGDFFFFSFFLLIFARVEYQQAAHRLVVLSYASIFAPAGFLASVEVARSCGSGMDTRN